MRYTQRMVAVGLSGILLAGLIASGCEATRPKKQTPESPAPKALKQATVSYIKDLCKLSKDQREPTVRELNEALLPNHAAISCGRGGEL
jgi:hypothetical protein